jgi:YbbR domain-containing protein
MTMKSMSETKEQTISNRAYKIVAFVAALILWFTVLGKKEITFTKTLPVVFHSHSNASLEYQPDLNIQVEVVGRRSIVKEFKENSMNYSISLRDRNPGEYNIPVSLTNIYLPMGLRVTSIKPTTINVKIKERD